MSVGVGRDGGPTRYLDGWETGVAACHVFFSEADP